MMNNKKLCSVLLALFAGVGGFSQTDSTDLNLYSMEPEMVSIEDSIYYMNGDFAEYQLEFEIEEPDSLGKVWIEFILVQESANESLLFHQSFTTNQLTEAALIDGNTVSVSFGYYYIGATYKACIRIEDLYGSEVNTITKTLAP